MSRGNGIYKDGRQYDSLPAEYITLTRAEVKEYEDFFEKASLSASVVPELGEIRFTDCDDATIFVDILEQEESPETILLCRWINYHEYYAAQLMRDTLKKMVSRMDFFGWR